MTTHLTLVSSNKKTGPIPVSTSSKNNCPDTCPLKAKGCYAGAGPLALHWKKVTSGERGTEYGDFLASIKALPKGQLWRHNQAGDLEVSASRIDAVKLAQLTRANKGKKGFTYTHHDVTDLDNLAAVTAANRGGFTVNVSCNTAAEAAATFKRTSLPTVAVLPMSAPNSQEVDGVKVVACPAEKTDKVNCAKCGLCADAQRNYVIGFRAHGTSKKAANVIASA